MANPTVNSRIYVAPANPAGRALAEKLSVDGFQVLGFADNLKKSEDIVNSVKSAQDHDFLVVAAGRYQQEICRGLVARGFDRKKLRLQIGGTANLKRFQRGMMRHSMSIIRERWRNLVIAIVGELPRKQFVYYAEEFIDTNVLLAWKGHVNRYPAEAILVAVGIDPLLAEKVSGPHKTVINRKCLAVWYLMRAKVVIVDHEYSTEWFTLIRKKRPIVQLWHGLPYKALMGNSHFPDIVDRAFISSSDWFNQNVFRKIFRAREYQDFGYPRCDALLQAQEKREWTGSVDKNQLKELLGENIALWIYMPTYRDNSYNTIPIDFEKLDNVFRENNRVLILKLHPFLQKIITQSESCTGKFELIPLEDCSNIFIYPAQMNIYTWLAESEGLITDYSSVAFDYSVLKRPIIYFQYDRDSYQKIRGDFWVNEKKYAPGKTVLDQAELQEVLELSMSGRGGQYADDKDNLCSDINKQDSIPKIIDFLRGL